MNMYQPVPRVPDFPVMEREMLRFWEENRIFDKLREQNADGPRWSFLDGPITANNPMGVHHAWGRSLKDMYQRYHAMNGQALRYQNGFDCQGLWVEVEVEKSLGLQTKREIRDYGIEKFVRACKERVLTYAARQTEQSIRLGYWCDWDDPAVLLALRDALADGDRVVTVKLPSGLTETARASEIVRKLGSAEYGGSYFTFSDENNYTIWGFLKKCHEQGFIYRGHDVMPWCGRCGTGLSQMEVAEGRRITTHTSVFVRFPIKGQEKTALLVWTTTPWTLASNVAVAVNPEMTYLKVRHGDWIYYVAKANFERDRVQELQVEGKHETHKLPSIRTILKGSGTIEVLEELPGSKLLGLTYTGPFDDLPAQNTPGGVFPYGPTGAGKTAAESHRVIAWKEVSEAEGTGLVHIAPGCGAEDQELGKENNLPFIAPLDESSVFQDGFGPLTGRNANEVADDVVAALKAKGLLVARERYPHVYPHCWRCKSELVFRPVDEWFIRMDWRDRIERTVPTIRWIPEEGEARELDWLHNMRDWMISKKRFWGLALPIWVCGECEHFTVIGSREELKDRAVEGWDTFEGNSPHRPYIDAVKIRCEKCGGVSTRVADVGNPWLDAGIVPFSTMRYSTDRAYWEKWFPADLVLESFPGQFRNWFYSMLAMSAMIDGRAPFKALLGHALVRDARGEEMHKSKGNSIAFDEAAEALGAEVMRYIYAEQKTAQNLNFPDLHPAGQRGPDDRWRGAAQAADLLELLQLLRQQCQLRWLEAGRRSSGHQSVGPLGLEPSATFGGRSAQCVRQLRALSFDRSVSSFRRRVLELVSAPLPPPLLGERARCLSDDLHRAHHRNQGDGASIAVSDRRDLPESGVLGRSSVSRIRSLDPLSAGGRVADRRSAGAKHRRGHPHQESCPEPADTEQNQNPSTTQHACTSAQKTLPTAASSKIPSMPRRFWRKPTSRSWF